MKGNCMTGHKLIVDRDKGCAVYWCGLCGSMFSNAGIDYGIEGTDSLVCDICGKAHAPKEVSETIEAERKEATEAFDEMVKGMNEEARERFIKETLYRYCDTFRRNCRARWETK